MSGISIIGPTREWVEEYDDQLEPIGEGYYAQVVVFEALGSDGLMYAQSLSMADEIGDQPEMLARFREMGAMALVETMRTKGVWPS